jgi:hypothetical protein
LDRQREEIQEPKKGFNRSWRHVDRHAGTHLARTPPGKKRPLGQWFMEPVPSVCRQADSSGEWSRPSHVSSCQAWEAYQWKPHKLRFGPESPLPGTDNGQLGYCISFCECHVLWLFLGCVVKELMRPGNIYVPSTEVRKRRNEQVNLQLINGESQCLRMSGYSGSYHLEGSTKGFCPSAALGISQGSG